MATTPSRTVRRTCQIIRSGAPAPRDLIVALVVELIAVIAHLPVALHILLAVIAFAGDRVISGLHR